MKIGIDVSPIVYGTGVSIYTKNLVENLLEIDKENKYTLFFSSLRREFPGIPGYPPQSAEAKSRRANGLKTIRIPPTALDILWNQLHIIPVETFVGNIDVFHCSDWTQPPAKKAKLVTTIHDLSFLRWPETAHPKVLAVQKRRLKWVEKEAEAVITISQATKKEIMDLTDIDKDKISVIYEDVSEDVKEFKSNGSRVTSLKEKYGIGEKYIWAMGSQAPRKNIERLIKSYELLVMNYGFNDISLVITGRYETDEKLADGIMTTGFLNRKELLSLMQGAEAFVYPSLYEGFGLPILEAFSLETPVVTSNCSSMAEIAGNAAVLVDPKSVESIADGINKVVGNKEVQKNLVDKGKRRLADFSWKKTAEETLKVYQRCR